ncbi:uncharacterized protein LOC142353696 isoform X2 [Convolutriloba macropyga]
MSDLWHSVSFVTVRTVLLCLMSTATFTVWLSWNFSTPFQLQSPALVGWAVALADVGRLVGACGLILFPSGLHRQYYLQCLIGATGCLIGSCVTFTNSPEDPTQTVLVFVSLFLIGVGSNPQLVNAMANVEHKEETRLNSIAFSVGKFLSFGTSLYSLVPLYGWDSNSSDSNTDTTNINTIINTNKNSSNYTSTPDQQQQLQSEPPQDADFPSGIGSWPLLSFGTLVVFSLNFICKLVLDRLYPPTSRDQAGAGVDGGKGGLGGGGVAGGGGGMVYDTITNSSHEKTPIVQSALEAKKQAKALPLFVWVLLISVSARGNPRSLMISMGPLLFRDKWHLSHSVVSELYFFPLVLSGLLFPLVSLSLSHRAQLLLASSLMCLFTLAFPFCPYPLASSGDLCLYGMCAATLESVRVPLLKSVFHRDDYHSVTRMVGAQHFVYTLFYAVSASYSGVLYSVHYWLPFVVAAIVNSVAGFGVGYFGVILWDKEQKQKDLVTPVTVDDGSGGQGGNHGNQVGYYQNPAPDSNVQNMYVGNGHTITNSSHSGKGIGGGNSKGFGYSTLIDDDPSGTPQTAFMQSNSNMNSTGMAGKAMGLFSRPVSVASSLFSSNPSPNNNNSGVPQGATATYNSDYNQQMLANN